MNVFFPLDLEEITDRGIYGDRGAILRLLVGFQSRIMVAERIASLIKLVTPLASKRPIRFGFVPAPDSGPLRYFAKGCELDFRQLVGHGFEFVPLSADTITNIDVIVLTAHGTDISTSFWNFRSKLSPQTIVAIWLWDNHISCMQSMRMALMADFVFPSHRYLSSYLLNPVSVLALHVPACSAQWSRSEAAQIFSNSVNEPRLNKALANYVEYPFSWRSELLRRLQSEVSEVEALLMSPENKTRYFSKSSTERLKEWIGYKATIILPIDRDVSTRVFDALLAGEVLLVPSIVADLDEVIPPADQKRLGIVRLSDVELPSIRAGIKQAMRVFDEGGVDGARARHQYALDNHMLVHRVASILERIREVAKGELFPAFMPSNPTESGLQLIQQPRRRS